MRLRFRMRFGTVRGNYLAVGRSVTQRLRMPGHSPFRSFKTSPEIIRLTLEFRQNHATFLAVEVLQSSVHRNILCPTGSGCCT